MSRISSHPTERDRYGLNMALAALARREQTYPGAADIVRCLLGQIDNEHATKEPSYDTLLCEVEALRKDAERYRWLRDMHQSPYGLTLTIARVGMMDLTGWSGDDPDRYIDAAMAAKEGV